MKKYIKKHIKDEKRILKLMYRKGLFETLRINLKYLAWEYLLQGKRQRRRGKNKYAFIEYLPELHVWTQDYWGEADTRSVVGDLRDYLFWENVTEMDEHGFPLNSKHITNDELIKYLSGLPTKIHDSKFNSFLKINLE